MNTQSIYYSLVGILPFAGGASALASSDQPNVIVIYIDDMGIGDLGCYGGTLAKTPNIDQLAADGIQFTQYYSASPVSSPSRVGVTTGQFPINHGINTFLCKKINNARVGQRDFLEADAPSMARAFKQAGYQTAHIGKWHMGGGRDVTEAPAITEYGFDEYISTYESPDPAPELTATRWIWSKQDSIKRWKRTEYFVDKTIDFIKRKKDQPFFLNLWPDDMHTPWVPESFAYKAKHYQNPEAFIPVLEEMDRQLGRLFDTLKQLDLDENTIVVFTSDNGPGPSFDQQRTLGKRGLKNSLYEGGVNMPMLMKYPAAINANQVNETTVVSAVDLYPTLCALANIKTEDGVRFDGQDMKSAILNSGSRKSDLMWAFGHNTYYNTPSDAYHDSPELAIRRGDFKLLIDANGNNAQLFDLSKDPKEKENIAQNNEKKVAEMSKTVIDWFKKTKKEAPKGDWKKGFPTVKNRWSKERINAWYDALPWLVGCNYYPATAINQIDMWQSTTWDPKTITKELKWAQEMGMNTLRVYLHDLVWADDEQGLYERMDAFLAMCKDHDIRPSFVFFDDCHWPEPKLGEQPLPVNSFHNSGWLNSPSRDLLHRYAHNRATSQEKKRLKGYVQATLRKFKDDERVLYWELYNEPGNEQRWAITNKLLYNSWEWAREVNPSQPICSTAKGAQGAENVYISRSNSDLHSIHEYSTPEKMQKLIDDYKRDGRPVVMTEWLARTTGNTVEDCLPLMKKERVGAINWGFVNGEAATIWPWDSKEINGVKRDPVAERIAGNVIQPGGKLPEPELWFHDLLKSNGKPYDKKEYKLFRELTKGQPSIYKN